ncbi:MAG: hypothetical protein AB9882_00920 [Ignavibacteriaceae bacterium]
MKRTSLFYIRLLAIVLNIAVFVFWGAFFIEHVSYFFSGAGTPPAEVRFIQFYHFLFLAGLLLTIKWNYPGALLSLISSLFFFRQAAGENFLIFFLLSNIGSLLWFGIAGYNFKIRNKHNNNNIKNTEQL